MIFFDIFRYIYKIKLLIYSLKLTFSSLIPIHVQYKHMKYDRTINRWASCNEK